MEIIGLLNPSFILNFNISIEYRGKILTRWNFGSIIADDIEKYIQNENNKK